MKPIIQLCEKKIELFCFFLKLQGALLERLSEKDVSVAEKEYAVLKDEYFHMKTLLLSSSLDESGFDKKIDNHLREINEKRLKLLRANNSDFNPQLIVQIERKFFEFQALIQAGGDVSAVKEALSELILAVKINIGNLCDVKHRLLFFELHAADAYIVNFENLARLVNANISNDVFFDVQLLRKQLKDGREQYQKINDLFAGTVNYQQILKVNVDLEKRLEEFFNLRLQVRKHFLRILLFVKEKFVLSLSLVRVIENQLLEIDDVLEKIICEINGLKKVSEKRIKDFESKTVFAKQLVAELCVVCVLQDRYSQAHRLAMLNLLLQKWLQELQRRNQIIKNKYSQVSNISRVLQEKELISTVKAIYSDSIWQAVKQIDVLTYLHAKIVLSVTDSKSVNSILQDLQQECERLRQAIEKIENGLGNYTWSFALPVFVARLATHNWYFRMAETYVRSVNEFTTQAALKNVPIVNAHLNESQLNVLAGLQTAIFVGIEIGVARTWGVSYSFLSSLIELVMPDINRLNKINRYIGLDEINTMHFLPAIKWLIGLQIQCLLYVYLTNDQDFLFPISSYIVATAFNKLMLSTFDFLSPRFSSNSLLRFFASNGAFLMSGWLWKDIYPTVKTFFSQPTDQMLLIDARLCEKYKVRCKNLAFKTLELDETASMQEVKEQFKKLALAHHPDKSNNGYTGMFFENIHHAKRRAIECLDEAELNQHIYAPN